MKTIVGRLPCRQGECFELTKMSKSVAEAVPKAVYAPAEYIKFGEGASKTFGFTKHVAIAFTVGLGLSFAWKVGDGNTFAIGV